MTLGICSEGEALVSEIAGQALEVQEDTAEKVLAEGEILTNQDMVEAGQEVEQEVLQVEVLVHEILAGLVVLQAEVLVHVTLIGPEIEVVPQIGVLVHVTLIGPEVIFQEDLGEINSKS